MDPVSFVTALQALAQAQQAQAAAPSTSEQILPWVLVTVLPPMLATLLWLVRRAAKAQDATAAAVSKIGDRDAAETERRVAAWVAVESRLSALERAVEREAQASRGEMVRLGNWMEGIAGELKEETRCLADSVRVLAGQVRCAKCKGEGGQG